MLWTIIGDTKEARRGFQKIREVLKKKQPEAEELYFNNENFSKSALEEVLKSQGLFFSKNIVILDNIFQNKESKEVIIENLKEIKESDHAFVLNEYSIDAPTKTELKKYSFDFKENIEAGDYKNNPFALADAVGNRDSKRLWHTFTEEITRGAKAEELHGQMVWQIKSILIAAKTKTAEEADMKDFPYRKAKGFIKNYKIEELEELLFKLVSAYHEAHRGKVELAVALEKIILEI